MLLVLIPIDGLSLTQGLESNKSESFLVDAGAAVIKSLVAGSRFNLSIFRFMFSDFDLTFNKNNQLKFQILEFYIFE